MQGSPILLSTASALALFTAAANGALVFSDHYESETPGEQTYIGDWGFVYVDRTFEPTPVSTLDIGTADPSPAGGNYLSFTTGVATYASGAYGTPDGNSSATFTLDAFESSRGHFLRYATLDAGMTYEVDLWRKIEHFAEGGGGHNFTVWNASGLDIRTPLLKTPSNLLAIQPYDMTTGGWQHVHLTFTTDPGDSPAQVAFMMGNYESEEFDDMTFDYDHDIRTVDIVPDGWEGFGGGGGWSSSAYHIDAFTLTSVPEPGSVLLTAAAAVLGLLRRKRG